MDSPIDIQSPTISETPEQLSNKISTPLAQKVHTNASQIFEDTPVTKTDISPPLLVAPGKGYGKIPKQDSITTVALHSETGGELELASPIFSHGAQYPALDGDVLKDMMEGIEKTSSSESERAENNSREEKTAQVLAPSVETPSDFSQAGVYLESRVQIEWIGTSTFFLEHSLQLQGAVSFSINCWKLSKLDPRDIWTTSLPSGKP
jgi:hypothetical protein